MRVSFSARRHVTLLPGRAGGPPRPAAGLGAVARSRLADTTEAGSIPADPEDVGPSWR